MHHPQLTHDTSTKTTTTTTDAASLTTNSGQNTIMNSDAGTSPLAGPQDVMARPPFSNKANVCPDPKANWDHKDSSEGQPSSHDSICDAAWISTSDVAKSPYQTATAPSTPPSLQPVTRPLSVDAMNTIGFDLESESPLSRLETPFLYGHGTELAPILEQRSMATLRTKGSLSTSDLSSLMHDAPGKSSIGAGMSGGKGERDNIHIDVATSLRQLKLRRHSPFSIDEHFSPASGLLQPLTDPKSSQNQKQKKQAATTESGSDFESDPERSSPRLKRLVYSRPTVHVVDVHTYPRKPIYPPPERPETPPSIRLANTSIGLQSRTRRPRSEGEGTYYTRTATRTASASGAPSLCDIPEFKFRPPRSGHGNLAAHPFVRQSTPSSASRVKGSGPGRHSYENGNEHDCTPTRIASGLKRPRAISSRRSNSNNPRRDLSLNSAVGVGGLANPYLAPPEYRGKPCRKCHHPSGEPWSLTSTIVGYGPGMRRGSDWCSRCACRKISRVWCC